ncbi:MAG TPA: DUF4183 domain-containing protein [Ureibacillus sp.]|nr:DUF4183 domain-containing protein [Ureibacillus sp.]
MALQLMKIAVLASAVVEVNPNVQRFFYVTTTATTAGNTLTIDAADFFDDTGNAVTALPELTSNNSSYNLFVNGVLQMEGISTYTSGETGVGSVEIEAIGGAIFANTPIIVEVVNYAPDTNITIET